MEFSDNLCSRSLAGYLPWEAWTWILWTEVTRQQPSRAGGLNFVIVLHVFLSSCYEKCLLLPPATWRKLAFLKCWGTLYRGVLSPRSERSEFAISHDCWKGASGLAFKNFKIHLCVYFLCSPFCILVCAYVHVHMYMWTSEVNHGYLSFFTLLFEAGSLTEPRACWFSKVGWPQVPIIYLAPSPQCWVISTCHHAWLLYVDSGDHTQVLMFVWQALYWVISPQTEVQLFSVICLIVCDAYKARTYLSQKCGRWASTTKQSCEVYLSVRAFMWIGALAVRYHKLMFSVLL